MIQELSENRGEVTPEQIFNTFKANYIDRKEPVHFVRCDVVESGDDLESVSSVKIVYRQNGIEKSFEAIGNGPIDAAVKGLEESLGIEIKVLDYTEHALKSGANAQAAAYIHLVDVKSGNVTYGVGISSNITRASLRGLFSAVNRLFF